MKSLILTVIFSTILSNMAIAANVGFSGHYILNDGEVPFKLITDQEKDYLIISQEDLKNDNTGIRPVDIMDGRDQLIAPLRKEVTLFDHWTIGGSQLSILTNLPFELEEKSSELIVRQSSLKRVATRNIPESLSNKINHTFLNSPAELVVYQLQKNSFVQRVPLTAQWGKPDNYLPELVYWNENNEYSVTFKFNFYHNLKEQEGVGYNYTMTKEKNDNLTIEVIRNRESFWMDSNPFADPKSSLETFTLKAIK